MLPWGEPPGAVLGWDMVLPIFTDMVLLYRNAATQSITSILAPSSARDSRHLKWFMRLKAFEKSTDKRLAAVPFSSKVPKILSQVSTRKCSALDPFTPPYCCSLSFTSSLSFSRTKDSSTLEYKGVQDKFLNSERSLGAVFFGMTLTDSTFHMSGQESEPSAWLKMKQTGAARRSANWVTSSGLISPLTIQITQPTINNERKELLSEKILSLLWNAPGTIQSGSEPAGKNAVSSDTTCGTTP